MADKSHKDKSAKKIYVFAHCTHCGNERECGPFSSSSFDPRKRFWYPCLDCPGKVSNDIESNFFDKIKINNNH